MATKSNKSSVDKTSFANLFRVGEIVQSGGDPTRKNASRMRITAIEEDAVRFQPIGAAASFRVTFSYLKLLLDHFVEIDPRSIQKTVNILRKAHGLNLDTTTENYAYGFARAYLKRSAIKSQVSIVLTDDGDIEAIPATRQGFQSSPAVRKAVEEHAIEMAREYFRSRGHTVETFGKPFDLLCTKASKRLYVEVKGTQGSGVEILLTRGEVKFHRDNPEVMALFVVSGIQIAADGQASGGTFIVKKPWVMNDESLVPYAFTYRV